MSQSPFILGLASVFAGLTALLFIGGVVSAQPVALAVAVPLGITSYFMYYHGSGKLARSVHQREGRQRRRTSDRGGFGAGPRSRTGPRTRAERRARAGRFTADGRQYDYDYGYDPRNRAPSASSGPTPAEARRTLGVKSGANATEIKRAYRKRVKETHPDRGGDKDEFKDVTAAYDRLSE